MNAGAVAYPIRWKDLITAKCLDTEAFFEGILLDKGRAFCFICLSVCLFCRPHTDLIPKVMQRFSVSSIKKLKQDALYSCVCLHLLLLREHIFLPLCLQKSCSLLLNETTSLWKNWGWKVPAVPDQKTKDLPSPHTPHSTLAPAAMQAGGLWLATNRNSWNIYQQTFSSMSLLTDLAPFSRFIKKKNQVIVVKW